MDTTTRYRTGLVLMAITGLLDIAELSVLGDPDSVPVGVILLAVALGVTALIAVALAWRGSRRALWTAVTTRVVDVVLGVPAFFMDAPGWVRGFIGTIIVLTVVGIGLVGPQLRRSTAPPASRLPQGLTAPRRAGR